MKYLYGASVQGIQSFIFQTNKLTEIIGASQLVEDICTDFFESFLRHVYKDDKYALNNDTNLILSAAGNIKYLFDSREACERVVRGFPKQVMLYAPGITISQAFAPFTGESDDFEKLEERLKVQRNRAVSTTQGLSLMVFETARRTGGIVVGEGEKDEPPIDLAQQKKRKAEKEGKGTLEKKLLGVSSARGNAFPNEMDDIKDDKNWVAVIHADGNNLGKLLLNMAEKIKADYPAALKEFSKRLDTSTIEAAKKACQETFPPTPDDMGKPAFRPIIIGGDDLTVLIRADRAVQFTERFLTYFEEVTSQQFKEFSYKGIIPEQGLTACAGIAYIKSTYPFHYGVKLAEALCKQAKNESKRVSKKENTDRPPSSLLFHKVHSSFVLDYDDLVQQELTAKRYPKSAKDQDDSLYFNYGPYFVQQQDSGFSTIKQLQDWVNVVNRPESPRSGLRNWLTEMKSSPVGADETLARIREIAGDKDYYIKKLSLNNVEVQRDGKWYTHLFDVLSLASIQSQHKPA